MSNKCEYAIVGDRLDNGVDMFGESDSLHIGEDLFIVLKSLFEGVLLEFGDGEYFGVIKVVVFVVLDVEDRVERVAQLLNLSQGFKLVHTKNC